MRGSTHRIPGLVLTDHRFDVPLDHTQPGGACIEIYAREIVAPQREQEDLPWLVFLQGGPGFGSPRPMSRSGWLQTALAEHRVLLLDQRGTARSSPVTAQTLAHLASPAAQAAYLKHFRADSIVRDCEWIRRELLGEDCRWSLLGQSYGGFCTFSYLSLAPQGLERAYVTGGIPPIGQPIDDIYRRTYAVLRKKNQLYYERYPDDVERVQRIAAHLASTDVRLPEGDRLTVRKLQQLGLHFGMSDGFEIVHYLLEEAFAAVSSATELSHTFLHGFEHALAYNTSPIYSILHEAAYCDGSSSRWSAERMRDAFPEFQADRAGDSSRTPIYFCGEMIYPWMFEEYGRLQPLRPAAELLAQCDDWPVLYDPARLRNNPVPTYAAVYYNDMYVERKLSMRTAAKVANLHVWVTNEYEHNGLRAHGDKILGRLLAMAQGDTYSGH
jgi:pimeloyl-ACP methyl ester carboxylesterase